MKNLVTTILLIFCITFMSFTSLQEKPPVDLKQDNRWVAPASSKKLKNPYSGKSSIKKGQAIYKMRCTVCHGDKGKGDGPGAKALNPKPADHTSKSTQSQTDGELFWKISEGRGAMVSWKLILSKEDRWNLVNFIRTLKAD